uniref:Uncharacterized protein n=1 Tax=Klebsiella pneumoniae TaxID=573 RepID=A0A8B0ST35_KLEPN|nr:hypothetical protein [Klebsiella pneumoniae]
MCGLTCAVRQTQTGKTERKKGRRRKPQLKVFLQAECL